MLCERCRADLSREPMPAELDNIVPVNLTHIRELLWLLWRHRGQWLTSDRVIAAVYTPTDTPLTVKKCISVRIHKLRRRLPDQYRIESQTGRSQGAYRLMVG